MWGRNEEGLYDCYCKKCGYSIHPWRYEQCDGMCEDCFYDEREKEYKDS